MENNQYTDLAEKLEIEGKVKTEDLEEQLDYFIQDIMSKTEEFTGLQTGFFELDTKMDGVQPGLTLIGGDSHHGKTMLFINMMLGIAENNIKTRVLFYSIDDARNLVIPKFIAYFAGESISLLKKKVQLGTVKNKRFKKAR